MNAIPKVTATVSAAERLSPEGRREWFPRLFNLPDARILQYDVLADDRTDSIQGEYLSAYRVGDESGRNFVETAPPRHYGFPVVLGNGTVRLFSFINWLEGSGSTQRAAVADFDPVALQWIDRPDAIINLPRRGFEKVPGVSGMTIDRSVLLQPDGSLIATMYGRYEPDEPFNCTLIRSADDGANWDYLSTIAFDPNAGRERQGVGYEGFCEPVLTRVKDGSLLAVMRTGAFENMFQTRSLDEGKTWSPPENMGLKSVDPDLCLMRNGWLACTYGRPGLFITFSPDGCGYSWTAPQLVFSGPRVHGRENSTCYSGVREIADGRLLVVYDENAQGSPWEATDNWINAVTIDVEIHEESLPAGGRGTQS